MVWTFRAALVGALLAGSAILCEPALAQRWPEGGRDPGQVPGHVPGRNGNPTTVTAPKHDNKGRPESLSRLTCEAKPDRVFVVHAQGSECIAIYPSPSPVAGAPTVIYFHGDLTAREVQVDGFTGAYLQRAQQALAAIAGREQASFVFVARPGVLGSSGNHGARWQLKEMLSMNAAIDAIKTRLGLTTIALAGQSGGSTIAAALLTLGRRDVTCAVFGSGALLLAETVSHLRDASGASPIGLDMLRRLYFDPSERISGIAQQPGRRIFVLGDPIDTRTPFDLQRRFAGRLTAFGHHAVTVEVTARGNGMHNVAHLTLPVAAKCARGIGDADIIQSLAPPQTGRSDANPASSSTQHDPAPASSNGEPEPFEPL